MTDEQYEHFKIFPLGGVLANRIALAMLLQGITVTELQQTTGMKIYRLRNIIYGRTQSVFLDSAMRIAAALNVSVEDLFELSHPAEEFYAKAEIVDATGESPVAGGDGASDQV